MLPSVLESSVSDADELALRVHGARRRIAVVDWRIGSAGSLRSCRRRGRRCPFALRMPIVTVWPIPIGLPTANTTSPTCTLSELPSAALEVRTVHLEKGEVARLIGATSFAVSVRVVGQVDFDVCPSVDDVVCSSGCSRRSSP